MGPSPQAVEDPTNLWLDFTRCHTPLCLEYILVRPVDPEYVWHGKENGKMTKDGIAQMVRNLGKRLGMRLSPHILRHSFAISFLRNGANPFELQIALGHTTLEMTRRYTQALGFDDVFKRHVLASPVDRLGK